MYIDSRLELSDAQALTATAVSTNTIDLVTIGRKIGVGEPLYMVFTVDVAADDTTGDETYELQMVTSANADLTSHDVVLSKVVAAADLFAGAQVVMQVPDDALKQYLGANYVLGGTTPALTISAHVTNQRPQDFHAYANATGA